MGSLARSSNEQSAQDQVDLGRSTIGWPASSPRWRRCRARSRRSPAGAGPYARQPGRRPRPRAPPADAAWLQEVRALKEGGHMIEAIKAYRVHTNVGLKEAKDIVEGTDTCRRRATADEGGAGRRRRVGLARLPALAQAGRGPRTGVHDLVRSRAGRRRRRWSTQMRSPTRRPCARAGRTPSGSAAAWRPRVRRTASSCRTPGRTRGSPCATSAELTPEEVAELDTRLERLDRAAAHGPWTLHYLELIRQHPQRRAPDLAELVGRETAPFKIDVRKLKNLGLTVSFPVGYEVSPRGLAYLATRPAHGCSYPFRRPTAAADVRSSTCARSSSRRPCSWSAGRWRA